MHMKEQQEKGYKSQNRCKVSALEILDFTHASPQPYWITECLLQKSRPNKYGSYSITSGTGFKYKMRIIYQSFYCAVMLCEWGFLKINRYLFINV